MASWLVVSVSQTCPQNRLSHTRKCFLCIVLSEVIQRQTLHLFNFLKCAVTPLHSIHQWNGGCQLRNQRQWTTVFFYNSKQSCWQQENQTMKFDNEQVSQTATSSFPLHSIMQLPSFFNISFTVGLMTQRLDGKQTLFSFIIFSPRVSVTILCNRTLSTLALLKPIALFHWSKLPSTYVTFTQQKESNPSIVLFFHLNELQQDTHTRSRQGCKGHIC